MENLKYEIQKVLAFYSIFDFPLTSFEVYKNLRVSSSFHSVFNCLWNLKNENKVFEKDGYYFLPALDSTSYSGEAEKRKARFLISFKKLKRAKRVARFFWRFPFIKFIGVCNSLGYLNADEESDIDFFIIVKRGRLWTARFLCAFFLKFFNLRPTLTDTKDKICLSFLMGENNLDISRVALKGDDPYLYHWMSWIIPLYDDGVYKKFIEKNKWIEEHLPNFIERGSSGEKPFPLFRHQKIKFTKLWVGRFRHIFANIPIAHIIMLRWGAAFFKRLSEIALGTWSEKVLKYLQLRVLPRKLKEATTRDDNSVVMSDEMLKFHLVDRRVEYRERFYQKVKSLNSKQTKLQIQNYK